MQLDCEHTKMTSVNSCGKSVAHPCCHLQDVIHEMREQDTIKICRHSKVNVTTASTLKIHVNVSKSITFTTSSVNDFQEAGVWYVQFEIKGTSRKLCTLALLGSHFQQSKIAVRNMNILIKDSIFTNSYVDFRSERNGYIEINNTEFNLTNENANGSPESNSLYINVVGRWTAVKLSSSSLIGNEMNTSSGIQIAAADIQSVMMDNIVMSHLYSALKIDSITYIVTFEMHDSIINENIDGINLSQAAMYVMISGCIFEGTGPMSFSERNRCSVAFKASTIAIHVMDSLFKYNRAVGKYCNGSALSITAAWHGRATSAMKRAVSDQLHLRQPLLVKIQNSSFFENVLADCYLNYKESDMDLEIKEDSSHGGAVVVLGESLQINVVNSTFIANRGCQGAGLYIGTINPKESNTFTINVVTCIFDGNEAHFGGVLMIAALNFSVPEVWMVLINCDNSTFHHNSGVSGSGGFIYLKDLTLGENTLLWISLNTSIFNGNVATGTSEDVWQSGGGMMICLIQITLDNSSALHMNLANSQFQNNTAAKAGAGMVIYLMNTLQQMNASISILLQESLFEGNNCRIGAGLFLQLSGAASYSIHLSTCMFIANVVSVENGGGISLFLTEISQEDGLNIITLESCSFLSNRASGKGGAIEIFMWRFKVPNGANHTVNFYKCYFTNNFARDAAAGIAIYQGYSCIATGAMIIISHCVYISNTVFNQGAALHFSISPTMRVEILHSTFLQNTARIGSGVYRDEAVMPTCFPDCKNHSQIMLISDSLFKDNLNTAILIQGGKRYCSDALTVVQKNVGHF